MAADVALGSESIKISSLVHETGVSKELIHHYLREGILPRPSKPARYSPRHLKLLRLVKRLREERFLPLPVIREIMEFNEYDPDRIELVLLSGSEMTAAAGVAAGPALAETGRFTLEELDARTGVSREVIEHYASIGLLRPSGPPGDEHFSPHDANIVSLVCRGTDMGIPLDSFRTIRSYIEVAFELEHALFLPGAMGKHDMAELAREFATRKEIANGFVLNVLTGLINGQLERFLKETASQASSLESAVYHPSDAFLRKHGVEAEIQKLRDRLGRGSRDPSMLLCLMRMFFFGGRYREVVFTAEQGQAALEAHPEAQVLRGYSLVLAGELERGTSILERAREGHLNDPILTAYLAAARFHKLAAAGRVEAALRGIQEVTELAEAALDGLEAKTRPADATEVRLVCGWILTSLPLICGRFDRGLRELEAVHEAAAPTARPAIAPEPLRLRFRLESAYLLHGALGRAEASGSDAELRGRRRGEMKQEVLTLDPASDFALRLFLETDPEGEKKR